MEFNNSIPVSKENIIRGLAWKFLEQIGTRGVQIVIQILLARLLSPDDFGIISIVTVLISIASIIANSGFTAALVQKKNADLLDFSSVFYLNLIFTSLIYMVIYLIAPLIATFYQLNRLVGIIRVLSIILFFKGINSIQNAVIMKNLQFKKLFIGNFYAMIISGSLGVAMAFTGFGLWALVGQQLINQIIISIIFWFTINWRPQLVFSISRIRRLYSFSWKLLASSLLLSISTNIRNLIVGKIYSVTSLGYYDKGFQFPLFVSLNIDSSVQSVLFPALVSNIENIRKVQVMVRRTIITTSIIIIPVMVGLYVVADSFIRVVLTEKWLPSIPYMRIACILYSIVPISTANLQALKAIGRSDIILKLEIVSVTVNLIILIITMHISLFAIAIGMLVSSIIYLAILSYLCRKILLFSVLRQIQSLFPIVLLSLIMGCIIYPIKYFNVDLYIQFVLQVIFGIFIYFMLNYFLKLEGFMYLLDALKNLAFKKIIFKKNIDKNEN